MGTRLIVLGLPWVTKSDVCPALTDWPGGLRASGKEPRSIDRTRNRHRWTGRAYQGAWENDGEGTRQIALV